LKPFAFFSTWPVLVALVLAVSLAGCASTGDSPARDDGGGDDLDAAVDDGGPQPDAAVIDASPPDACVADPAGEVCNDLDDDCDGETDEGFDVGAACDGVDSDMCQEGLTKCDGQGATTCADPTGDAIETCNGSDDDCDGTTDEGFGLGVACDGVDDDRCAEGQVTCDGAGSTTCDDATGNSVETCNAADDDCDGQTDEGFGLGVACDGTDGDLCTEGQVVCAAGGGTTCSDVSATNIDLCNGADDDCDGAIDEGWNIGAACDGNDGDTCNEGQLQCGAGGMTLVCSDATGTTTESCNGADDDCNEGVDEGFDVGGACTSGTGACASPGTRVCSGDGSASVCNATPGNPGREFCGDGIDHDCSGGADPTCPSNDLPGGAIDVSAGGVFTTDLTFAHDDASGSCSSTGGRDVFYQLTLATRQIVYFDTFGSSFDTSVRIHAGACSTSLGTFQTCGDDACSVTQTQLAADLAAGTFCVVVDQYSEFQTSGALTLNVVLGGRTGTRLAGPGTVAGNTCGQASLTGECGSSSAAPEIAYYLLTCPGQTSALSASTCGGATTYDSVLYFRDGNAMEADATQVCNDDACSGGTTCTGATNRASSISTPLAGAGLRWVIVDGFSTGCSNCGPFNLAVTF
jgi:hypothetical protein